MAPMRRYAGYLLFAVFLGVLAAGLAMGEFRDVLTNAITICLSCIGIG
jgi:hypothetical protein